jgi:NADP-dependent 3-hydroxy acid dehydrogenase YdfG
MSEARTILVTGASSGIGQAICTRLLKADYRVIGLARSCNENLALQEQFIPVKIDLGNLDELPDRLLQLAHDYPEIDGLVCCAGRGRFGSLEEFSFQQIRDLLDLNFISQVWLTKTLLPLMKQRKRGDIVFIGSEAGLNAGKRGAVYSAGKFALRGFAQALRAECSRSGIRICLINPGMVKTPFFDQLEFSHGDQPANYLLPEDVANSVAMVLDARPETVFDEINLTPLKKVIKTGE